MYRNLFQTDGGRIGTHAIEQVPVRYILVMLVIYSLGLAMVTSPTRIPSLGNTALMENRVEALVRVPLCSSMQQYAAPPVSELYQIT